MKRTLRTSRGAAAGFALGLALGVPLVAAARGQATAPPKPAGYSIAGRVVNSTTGEPVRRATVAALAEEHYTIVATAVTDNEGRFSLDGLPAAKYPLTASKRGYRTAYYDEHDNYNSAIVTGPGQDTTHLVFQLTPGAVLHGVVTGDGGDPVENASVMLYKRPSKYAPSEHIARVEAVTTDDTGAYEFSNLAPGDYALAVKGEPWFAQHHKPAGSEAQSPLDVVYPITYFDSTMDEASASTISLAPGAREEADVTLQSVPGLHLKLALPTRNGRSMPQAELRMNIFGQPALAESPSFNFTDHSASVEFDGLAPGHYELTQGNPPRVANIDATTSGELDPGLGAATVSVSGTLRVAGAGSLPDSAQVYLTSPGVSQTGVGGQAVRGAFKIDGVPPGTWTVAVSVQGQQLPVVAVTGGAAAPAGDQVRIDEHTANLVVTVSRAQVRLYGFAKVDGKPAPGAMIVLVPRDRRNYQALVRRDQSDSDGSFALRDVAAGQYTVVAIDGWNIDWQSYDAIARYLPHGVSVTVGEQQAGSKVSLSEPVPVSAP